MDGSTVQKLGRYEIEREIGRGGMAIVYKAHDPRLDRPVAIKLIRMNAFSADAFGHVHERFEREAKALARLDHPNILKVHDFGEHEGAPYLVMDYIEGSTLKELKKPVRVDTAVKLLTPIADALEYVHAQGLLHRDVKPSNIMITQNGRVILTDFGIVKSLEEDSELHTLTATGVGIGTPEYMSPEQGRGMKVDARSDMYSLSIVFYELITGRKPFTGDTPVNILLKQIREPLPDPRQFVSEISPSVKKFLDRAAAKDPDDRYPTTREYLLDFEGLRLQAQTNRAVGQSNSGFQSLPRKTESTSSSIEIGKADLAKVRAEAAEPEHAQAHTASNLRISNPPTARVTTTQPKRIPWGALTFGLVTFIALIVGIYVFQGRGADAPAQTQAAADAQISALTAEAARELALIERKTATEAEARANATGTVGFERTVSQATFEDDMRATERIVAYEATQTQAMIAIAQTATESARETQASIDDKATAIARITQAAIARLTQTAEAEAISIAQAQTATQMAIAQTTQNAIQTKTASALAIELAQTESARQTQAAAQALTATQMAKYQVGDIIRFGRYEQDNNKNNGAEEIEWRILAREGDIALVVSVMGLDAKPYNKEYKDITWEECTLRAWLNNEFYNGAFNDTERAKIELTHVVNEDNPSYSTKGGNDTEDYIFLLSIAEAKQYFKDYEDLKLKPTKYAIANGAWTNSDNGNGWWWLRSPGKFQSRAAGVTSDGAFTYIGPDVYIGGRLVRPALRINLGK